MRFSEAKGHKVVSTDSAETVGKVAGFVVDPRSASVVALSLKKTGDHGTTLPWTGITAFGPDAVTAAPNPARSCPTNSRAAAGTIRC